MEFFTLNNGEQIPVIGTGTNTYGKENNEYQGELTGDFEELETAIESGYRSVDAAISYRNEAGVGETIANSKVPRDEFYLTTKIPNGDEYVGNKDAVRSTIENSLKNFHTDYLDLYLIHHPIENKEQFQLTWEVFEEYYNAGKLKSIGVSNFDIKLMEELKEFSTVKPAVNQIQINAKEPNRELIDYLQKEDITPMAWGPMKATDDQKETLEKIGENYGKTWGQVLLRYQIDRGIVVIPKSHDPKNQKENLEVMNFALTKEDQIKIAQF